MSTQYLLGTCIRFPSIIRSYLKLTSFFKLNENYTIKIETDRYLLKTANHYREIFQLLLLRYRNFLSRSGTFMSFGIDLDEFDSTCDHLIVIDKVKKKICGTYRLRASTYTDVFYSENEFDLNDFLKIPGIKLELGRACIDKQCRDGAVINLLWKGIGLYAKKSQARFLFGCSSIKTLNKDIASSYYRYFKANNLIGAKYKIFPLPQYKENLDCSKELITNTKIELPPLLRIYLAGGAKIYGSPAFDYSFKCIDFLTILDLNQLNLSFKRRFFKEI